jgi:hypothetical protein
MKVFSLYILSFFLTKQIFSLDFYEYEVKKGDSLNQICKKELSKPEKWRDLLSYNSLPSPHHIKPGLKIKIPFSLSNKKENLKQINIAELTQKKGIVKSKKDLDLQWNDIDIGNYLMNNELLKTSQNSMAEVYFLDEPRIKIELEESSIMKIARDTNPNLSLEQGRIHFNSNQKNADVKIKNDFYTCELKGTDSEVSVKDNLATFASFKGQMNVKAQNKLVNLEEGYCTYVIKGQEPMEPFLLINKVKIKPIIKE